MMEKRLTLFKPRYLVLWGIFLALICLLVANPFSQESEAKNDMAVTPFMQAAPSTLPTYGTGQKLASFVVKTVSSLRYSVYKLGGNRFDLAGGVYIIDCSSYVDHMLNVVSPKAYSSLVDSTGTNHPTSRHYYQFFNSLSAAPKNYWNKIRAVSQLQPGDILVFCYKHMSGHAAPGHVMIVVDKPVKEGEKYIVSVADSACAAHSNDTRSKSGVGIGKMALKVDPSTDKPVAYAWKEGSNWKDNVNFAMGRPV